MLIAYDFYHFWAAGRVALRGGNPYELTPVYQEMLKAGWPGTEGFFGFLHPFWALWLFTPFSLLPLPIAICVWELSIFLIVAWAIYECLNLLRDWQIQLTTPLSLILIAFSFPPVFNTIQYGQTNAITLLGIIAWLKATRARRQLLGGALLSLTAIKPQLFVPLYTGIFLSDLLSKRYQIILGFAIGLAIQVAISCTFYPASPHWWLSAMRNAGSAAMDLPTASLPTIIAKATGADILRYVPLCIAFVGTCFWIVAIKVTSPINLAGFLLPVSMLCSTYVWSGSFLPLLPVYLIIIGILAQRNERLVLYASVLIAIFGVAAARLPIALDRFLVVLPLSIIFAWSRLSRNHAL
jgi:hypothetical protein